MLNFWEKEENNKSDPQILQHLFLKMARKHGRYCVGIKVAWSVKPPSLLPCIRSPGHMLVGEYQLLTNCLLISISRLSSEMTYGSLDQGSPSLVSVLLFDMGSQVVQTGLELLFHLHPECWGLQAWAATPAQDSSLKQLSCPHSDGQGHVQD